MAELSDDGLSVKEQPRQVMTPWTSPDNWQVECECLEAPKLLFHNGYYYLNVAEGGTSGPPTSHMVLSARSRNIDGPWEWSPHNPIVHTPQQSRNVVVTGPWPPGGRRRRLLVDDPPLVPKWRTESRSPSSVAAYRVDCGRLVQSARCCLGGEPHPQGSPGTRTGTGHGGRVLGHSP